MILLMDGRNSLGAKPVEQLGVFHIYVSLSTYLSIHLSICHAIHQYLLMSEV